MKFILTREMQVPKGSLKIVDKHSDAVAYIYQSKNGKPAAAVFLGKSNKASSRFYYNNECIRELAVTRAFECRRAELKAKTDYRKERTSWVPTYKVGDIFGTCWGYDQTNREFFEITEIKGKFAILREIQQERIETHSMQGQTIPLPGKYHEPRFEGDDTGKPIRRLMQKGGIKIDDVRSASLETSKTIASVRVFEPSHWSSYA